MTLTPVEQAMKTILSRTESFGSEYVDFLEADGRVLKEDILADRDFPPFNRVSMDGIAIDLSTFQKGSITYPIEGVQAAGSPQLTLKNSNNCIEVMTGAMLPENTNAVIPYELVSLVNGNATITVNELKSFQNIHLQGTDKKKNDVLIQKNTLLSAAELGVLATVGAKNVLVAKQPKVIIISTGNELVDVEETPELYQIRRSNVFTLHSLLKEIKIKSEVDHIVDDKEVLTRKISNHLEAFDVLLFSGAVSKGKFDFIPEVLDNLGVEKLFHKVKQRPGKPFWFGKKGTKTVFAFPGNPVSTFVSCLKYFYPWYQKSLSCEVAMQQAVLNSDFNFKPSLTYFLQVSLENINGKLIAEPVTGKGSGDLANLVEADAFLELPADRSSFVKGEIFPVISYRK